MWKGVFDKHLYPVPEFLDISDISESHGGILRDNECIPFDIEENHPQGCTCAEPNCVYFTNDM